MQNHDIEKAFFKGNYSRVAALAHGILSSSATSQDEKTKAKAFLHKISVDPVVVWIGVGVVAFVSLIAYRVLV